MEEYRNDGWGNDETQPQHEPDTGMPGAENETAQTEGTEQEIPTQEIPTQEQAQSPYGSYADYRQPEHSQPRSAERAYRYRFEEYENAAGAPGRKSGKNRGLLAFVAILGVICVLAAVTFTGIGLYNIISRDGSSQGGGRPGSGTSESGKDGPAQGGLVLEDKPSDLGNTAADGTLTTTQIQKKVRPSVVGITKYTEDNPFTAAGEGSGIIMSADGYIVTNAHVVSGADQIGVVLSNNEDYVATLVGIDSKTDLAVLKIEAANLAYAEFGNSEQLEVGEKAVAIGYPGGIEFGGSTTEGIISGLNRMVKSTSGVGNSMNYIQTDAAINPGNSGGALINRFGQIIGINSAKVSNVNYEGIGFAIPINEAKPIIDELKANGRVTGRVKIGITIQPVTEALSKLNDVPQGVRIIALEPDSDAVAKGLIVGDIITKINDKDIIKNGDVGDALAGLRPGQSIKLTVFRKTGTGSQKTFEVTVLLGEDLETGTMQTVPTGEQ